MVIERLLRTVEKGTCGVGSRRRVLGSGPAAWSRCEVPLWGPAVGSSWQATTPRYDIKPRRRPATSSGDAARCGAGDRGQQYCSAARPQ
jgi:hypothetical protein